MIPWTSEERRRIRANRDEDVCDEVNRLNLLATRMADMRRRWEKLRGQSPLEGTFAIDFDMAKVALTLPALPD